ncbi:sugar ABC transporter substrate-binding protein [Arthrobacter parietis]|uniref:Sugar ABC transporter substrate-binding protein n=2 Tax=Arthrobacter TaxID=1663 RepID=A0ABT6CUW2_9MICC|nr:sugar ABC transporter substrate-binding protein [Arthrobacter vasquezii]MDF9276884.1 sugar ABC transporter substrate-binding protein [Arthrobacter vasquezii]
MSPITSRLGLSLAAVLSLSLLTACGGSNDQEVPAAEGPYEAPASDITAEITISNWGDPGDEAIYDDVSERFNEQYPNVTVNNDFTPITTWTEYVNKLVSSVAAGNAPDVINIATEGVDLGLHNELFAPLDGYIQNDPEGEKLIASFDPALVEGFTEDGSTYLMPNTWNSMLIYYNTKLFEEAGIERPSEDWTWNEFLEISRKLTTGEGEDKVYGFGLPYFNFGLTPWLYSNSASQMSEDGETPTLDDPATVESATWIRDLVTEEGVAPQPKGADPYQLFPAGKVAMTGAGHWVVGPFEDAGFSDYDILPWPQNSEKSTVFGGGGFAVSEQSDNKDLAWEYIKMLTDIKTQQEWAAAGAAIPANKDAAQSESFLAYPEHAELYYDSITYAEPVAAPRVYNTLEPAFMRAMDEILAGGDPQKELSEANDEVQEALDRE